MKTIRPEPINRSFKRIPVAPTQRFANLPATYVAQPPALPPAEEPLRGREYVLNLLYIALAYGLIPGILIMTFVCEMTDAAILQHALTDLRVARINGTLWALCGLLYFLRVFLTPRREALARLLLLLMMAFSFFVCFEFVHWGALLPGGGFLAEGQRIDSVQLIAILREYIGIPIQPILFAAMLFYGVMAPILIAGYVPSPHGRRYLLQVIPTPRLIVWFFVSAVLASGQLNELASQIGILCISCCYLLVALTPKAARQRFAWPDSGIAFLFLLSLSCFATVLIRPQQLMLEEQRINKLYLQMYAAIASEKVEKLAKLLSDADGERALREAPLIVHATKSKNKALISALIARGADPRITDKDGRNALEIAVSEGTLDVALRLIEAGLNPNIVREGAATPLITAIHEKNIPLAEALLQSGASPNIADGLGRLPLQEAARMELPQLVMRLVAAGADSKALDKEGKDVLQSVPKDSETELLVMAMFLSDEEIEARLDPPALRVLGSPSMVWDSSGESQKLIVLSVTVINEGQVDARNVQLSLRRKLESISAPLEAPTSDAVDVEAEEGEAEEQDPNLFPLQGPDELAAGDHVTFILSEAVAGQRKTLHLEGQCQNCESDFSIPLSVY